MKHKTKILQFVPGDLTPCREDLNRTRFKEQLQKAYKFRDKHFRNGIPIWKIGYLYELEHLKPVEGVINAYNLGYMMGYQAAKRDLKKKNSAGK